VINHVSNQSCLSPNNRTGSTVIFFIVAVLTALSTMFPCAGEGAEYQIHPAVTLGEEYNDNIFLTPENESSDFISRITPAVTVVYGTPLWDWNVNALYEYRYYARYHDNVPENYIPNLSLTNHTRIKDQYMYLDIREYYSRTSVSPIRDYTQESAFVNQTDRNLLTVNPYFISRPTSQITVTTGYNYSNTWYKDPRAVDQVTHTIYTGLQQDLTLRTFMTYGIRHALNKNKRLDYTQDDVYVGFTREYVQNSTFAATIGNTWFHSQLAPSIASQQSVTVPQNITQITWDVNLTHRYSTMTVIYETGLRFIPDPYQARPRREDRYMATLRRDVPRTSISASGGLFNYRDIIGKHLQSSVYRLSGSISHAITSKSTIIFNLSSDWTKDYQGTYSTQQRYITNARLEHLLKETLTLSLEYRYSYLYDPTPNHYWNNYTNNRISVELRKVF
jgi:hypothetical protein